MAASSTTTTDHDDVLIKSRQVGEKMKEAEGKMGGPRVNAEKFWLVRLDGHGFSKFTRGFAKPFDERIHLAMSYTAGDLLTAFTAASVYTESDEITVIFPSRQYYLQQALNELHQLQSSSASASPSSSSSSPSPSSSSSSASSSAEESGKSVEDKIRELQEQIEQLKHSVETSVLPYGGKVQKLVSLMAGYCSTRFNFHLSNIVKADESASEASKQKASGATAYFDARIFELDSEQEVFDNICWRASDAARNSKSMFGRAYFSAAALHKLSANEVIAKALAEKGADYHTTPAWFRAGVLIKRINVMVDTKDRQGQPISCQRRRTAMASWLDVRSFSASLLLSKSVSDSALSFFATLPSDLDA